MKILIRVPFTDDNLDRLKTYFDEIIYQPWTVTGKRYYEDEMLEVLNKLQVDAIITELDKITEKVLKNYKKLQFIGDCRATPENIDINACTKRGIAVLCTPARNSQAVAEMLVGLLINYIRNVIPAVNWLQEGKWIEGTTPYFLWMGNELKNKKIGFVGFGAVGKATANILEAFDCQISFYDPYVDFVKEEYKKTTIEDIFKNSDIVTVHLPVLDSTINLIDKDLLSTMKKDAIFVNTSRSAVVNEKDLIDILRDKKIKGAIIDVLSVEPPTKEALKIASLDNVLLTPHICGATFEVSNHQENIITKRIEQWFKKEDLEKIIYNNSILTR